MGFLSKLKSIFRSEGNEVLHRNSPENPSTPLGDPDQWLVDYLGGGDTDSGLKVDGASAIGAAAVYQCVNMLSSDVGKLPTNVFKRLDDNHREKDREHPAFWIIRHKANQEMTSGVLKKLLMHHVLLWGNAYAFIERDRRGNPMEMLPLLPDRTHAERKGGVLRYRTRVGNTWHDLEMNDVFHIKGLSFDGVMGYSVVSLAKQSFGLILAAEKFGNKFFSNGAVSKGVLSYPGSLSPQGAKNLTDSFDNKHRGLDNAHKTILLEEGTTFHPMSVPPNDAQFIETRAFQRKEVASWFNIPPARLGDLEAASYNTLEQLNEAYLESALDPWLIAIEDECNDKLLTEKQKRSDSHFIETNRSAILRTNLLDRYKAWSIARQWGWMSVNDILRKENEPPIDEQGDIYLIPQNMIPADKANELGPNDSDAAPGDGPGGVKNDEGDRLDAAKTQARELVKDTCGRLVRRLNTNIKRLGKHSQDWEQRVDDFLTSFEDSTREMLKHPINVVVSLTHDDDLTEKAFSRRLVSIVRHDLLELESSDNFDEAVHDLCEEYGRSLVDYLTDDIITRGQTDES